MRDAIGAVGICIIIALVGCMSSPYLEDSQGVRQESEYLRAREELHDYRESVNARATVTVDDGSLDHVDDMTGQMIDPMMDDDMRIVIEARNVIETRVNATPMTREDWFREFRIEVRKATNAAAAIEPADRSVFRHPETIADNAWCAWYVREDKRRELTIDPITREVSQSLDWR